MMINDVKVAVISGVRHADDYIGILSEIPGARVVGIVDEIQSGQSLHQRSPQLAQRLRLPYIDSFGGLDDLRPDLAVICTEPVRHAEAAIASLVRGIPTIIDKPCATVEDDLDKLLATARSSTTWATVINRLAAPSAKKLRAAVNEGTVGLPLIVNVEFVASGAHLATSVGPIELIIDPSISGGGELINFLPYVTDLLFDVLCLDAVRVAVLAGNNFSDGHKSFGVEDSVVVNIEFERGVTAVATVARAARTAQGSPTSCLSQLTGTHGYLKVSDEEPAIVGRTSSGALFPDNISLSCLRQVFDEAVDCVRWGGQPRWTLESSARSMSMLFAARRSMESGEWEEVNGHTGGK